MQEIKEKRSKNIKQEAKNKRTGFLLLVLDTVYDQRHLLSFLKGPFQIVLSTDSCKVK